MDWKVDRLEHENHAVAKMVQRKPDLRQRLWNGHRVLIFESLRY